MSYLIQNDYKKLIQSDNLNQVIGSDLSILASIELAAQAECISYLTQKYITAEEFTNTSVWSPAIAYKANARVYLDASAYSASATYPLNSLVLQGGYVYICHTAITTPEAFTPAKWTSLGLQYALFYVTVPKPEFNYLEYYAVGDEVFWKDKTYTARIETAVPTHESRLQAGSISDAEVINIFPNDPVNGVKHWGTGTAYALSTGTLPTDTTKWTSGDNRNPQLVNYCIDVALYHVHSRIAPRNIPELRVKRYDDAIAWLKMAGRGDITADLPLIQPKSGGRIRYGGNTKNINQY